METALVKKKVLMPGSKEIDNINNSDIYDTYKDLFLSKKECEEKLLQGIQEANVLKACLGAKKAGGTALALTAEENTIKETIGKRFEVPLDFNFLNYLVFPYGLHLDLIVRLKLNSAEKVILATGDTWGTYKVLDIALDYDAIFDEPDTRMINEMCSGITSILYTKITSIHYQILSKKDTAWKIDVNNFSVRSLQGLLLIFLDK